MQELPQASARGGKKSEKQAVSPQNGFLQTKEVISAGEGGAQGVPALKVGAGGTLPSLTAGGDVEAAAGEGWNQQMEALEGCWGGPGGGGSSSSPGDGRSRAEPTPGASGRVATAPELPQQHHPSAGSEAAPLPALPSWFGCWRGCSGTPGGASAPKILPPATSQSSGGWAKAPRALGGSHLTGPKPPRIPPEGWVGKSRAGGAAKLSGRRVPDTQLPSVFSNNGRNKPANFKREFKPRICFSAVGAGVSGGPSGWGSPDRPSRIPKRKKKSSFTAGAGSFLK